MGNSNLNGCSSTTGGTPSRTKLTGRKFYESIGSPKLILAPMVDRSEFAWRLLTRSFLNGDQSKPLLAYSPMFHARLFAEAPKNRHKFFQPIRQVLKEPGPFPGAQPFLDGNPAVDRPLIVQFCANDPDEMLAAARFVEPYCDAVDLNLGCPQGIARKGNYGAFLQEDWDLIYKLINKLHNELSIPVTAKLRIQETKEKTLEYARMILSAGASIITVHGRRREQKGHNTGTADWSYIRYLRDNLPPDTVIFSNGNILSHADIEPCFEATGVDGVMSAEGNLSDPTIFAKPPALDEDNPEYWRGKNGQGGYRIDAVFRRYLDIIYQYVLEREPPSRPRLFVPSSYSENHVQGAFFSRDSEEEASSPPPRKKQKLEKESSRTVSPSIKVIQGHLFGLLRKVVAEHTDIRDALAGCRLGDMDAFEGVLHMVERAVAKAITEYEDHPEPNTTATAATEQAETQTLGCSNEIPSSSATTAAKYSRPWWICQPYIRPLPSEAYEIGALRLSKKELAKLKSELDGREREREREREKQTVTATDVPESSQAAAATTKPVEETQTKTLHDLELASELPREAVVCG